MNRYIYKFVSCTSSVVGKWSGCGRGREREKDSNNCTNEYLLTSEEGLPI
jgi:hypothetical protein